MAFPLLLSQAWGGDWFMSFLGFVISGVLVTLIGLFAGVLTRTTHNFFLPLGIKIGFLVQLVLICIEGPFGVVPRCFIVAFGGLKSVFTGISALYFYIILSVVLYCLAINKSRLVSVIGQYLTPLLLILLFLIFSVTLYVYGNDAVYISISKDAFVDGLFKGYLTYDLPGAIYFTTIAMTYLQKLGQSKKEIISNGLKACSISAVLLILVYVIFFYLGLSYRELVLNTPAEQILPTIVKHAFGETFSVVFALFVLVACLTTAVAAITIWVDFLYYHLKKFNIKYNVILASSLVVAVVVSTLEFGSLMLLLAPVLNVIYPVLIFLSLYNIFTHIRDVNVKA